MEDDLSLGILTTDKNLNITYWNSWLEKNTGISSKEALGNNLFNLFPELKSENIRNILEDVLSLGVVRVLSPKIHKYLLPIKLSFPSKYFDHMQQLVIISPLKSEREIVGLIITIEDVTERFEEEYELKAKLKDPDERIRMEAIKKLSQRDKGEILEALSDENWRVRKVAIEEIKSSVNEMVIELLKKMKNEHHNLSVLNSIIKVLSSTKIDIVDTLAKMLKDEDPDLRIYTVQLLQTQKDPRVEDIMISALSDKNPNVVFTAIEGLGKIKSQKAVPYLLDFVRKKDFYLSIPALESLKEIKDPSILPHIYPLLEEDLLSSYVIEILGEIGDEYSVKVLVTYLNNNTQNIEKTIEAIGKIYKNYNEKLQEGEYILKIVKENIKPEGIKNLISSISNLSEESLKNMLPLLGEIKEPVVERILIKFLGNPNLRNEIVETLVKYGKSIVPLLVEKLKDDDKEIKMLSIIALGRIGDNSVVPHLVEVLEKEEDLAVVCAGALAKIGDRRAFEPLIRKLGNPNPYIRQAVISAINSLGHPDLPKRLKELLKSDNVFERESAIKIAGYFGFEECKEGVFKLIDDENEEIRKAVYENIVFFEDERIIDLLKSGLEREKRKVREVIAKSLVYLDTEKALPLIEIALHDSSPWVRYYGVKSLVFHNPPSIFEMLEDLLKREDTNLVKIIIIDSLGDLGNKKALPILKSFLQVQDKDLVYSAIRAVGKIKHPESINLLVPFLSSQDKVIKIETLRALGNQGVNAPINDILWSIASEEDKDVISEGFCSLLKIETLESLKALLSLSLDSNKRELAIKFLSQIPERFIDLLIKETKNVSPILRKNLILALEMRKKDVSNYIKEFIEDDNREVKIQAISSLINIGSYEILRGYIEKERDEEIRNFVRQKLEMNNL